MHYKKYAQKLVDLGYKVVPVVSNAKNPAVSDWLNYEHVERRYDPCGVAIRAGYQGVIGIDLDIYNQGVVNHLLKFMREKHGVSLFRVGLQPKALIVARSEDIKRITFSNSYDYGKIEVLSVGQKFICFGIHPETKKDYMWHNGTILDVPCNSLPVLSALDIQALFDEFDSIAIQSGFKLKLRKSQTVLSTNNYDPNDILCVEDPLGWSHEYIQQMLDKIDSDSERNVWSKIGMGIHHETNGSHKGFALWDNWSMKGSKYVKGDTAYQWSSFNRPYGNQPIRITYLKARYNEVIKLEVEAQKKIVDAETASYFGSLNWCVTKERLPDYPPETPMLIEGQIPVGSMGMLYAMGGTGKSTFVLQLCMEIALCNYYPKYKTIFNAKCLNPGSTVILTAEEPDRILNLRFFSVMKTMSETLCIDLQELREMLMYKFFIVSTCGHNVQFFTINNDGFLEKTAYFDSFTEQLKRIQDLRLVIIDTKSRYSIAEGKGNAIAGQEIGEFEGIIEATVNKNNPYGTSVMLIHHTNKASRAGASYASQAYRDSTATFDNIKASWYLRPPDEKEEKLFRAEKAKSYFVIEHAKHNWTKKQPPILIERSGDYLTFVKTIEKLSKAQERALKEKTALLTVLASLQNAELCQTELIETLKLEGISKTYAVNAIINCEFLEYVLLQVSSGRGKKKVFKITETGRSKLLETEN